MYASLELNRPVGRTAAVIESYDGDIRVSFSESENLREALERIVANGFDVVIPAGAEQVEIKSGPSDPNFLETLARYLQLSFDFICLYKQVPELSPKVHLSSGEISGIRFPDESPTLVRFLEWQQKEPRQNLVFETRVEFGQAVWLDLRPSWITVE